MDGKSLPQPQWAFRVMTIGPRDWRDRCRSGGLADDLTVLVDSREIDVTALSFADRPFDGTLFFAKGIHHIPGHGGKQDLTSRQQLCRSACQLLRPLPEGERRNVLDELLGGPVPSQ